MPSKDLPPQPDRWPLLYDPDPNWTPEQSERAEDLANWWMDHAAAEVRKLVPKAIAYGSADLQVMGEAMLSLMPGLRGVVEGQELAIWFYVLGKVARLVGGYAQGELPDIDSWYDLRIYGGMAEHVREKGGW